MKREGSRYNSMMTKPENEIVISVEEMRKADAATIAGGIAGTELMYRAAYGVFESFDWTDKSTLIFCGSGNNGGDGYALAMILAEHGHDVKIVRLSEKLSEDGAFYYAKCVRAGVPMEMLNEGAEGSDHQGYDVIVDCILGTGFAGVPRGNAKTAIEIINSLRQDSEVISVDINSGMNGDTGEAEIAVISDLTVSIGYLKNGFFKGRADELIADLINVDIGIKLPE